MTAWTILARGPSLRACTMEDVLPGSRVIAVNGAIYHHAIPADYWIGLDDVSQSLDPDLGEPPWGPNPPPRCVTKNGNCWDDWHKLAVRYGIAVPLKLSGSHGELQRAIGDKGQRGKYGRWSVLYAVAFARMNGAKRIRILGMDMTGNARAYGKGRPIHDGRWADEAKDVAATFAECADAGVLIERWVPKTSISPAS